MKKKERGDNDGIAQVYKNGFLAPAEAETQDVRLEQDGLLGLTQKEGERLHDLLQRERALSVQRGVLHARIDFIRSQGVSGNAATADQIDYLMGKERALSDRRRSLHREIDQLRRVAPRARSPHE